MVKWVQIDIITVIKIFWHSAAADILSLCILIWGGEMGLIYVLPLLILINETNKVLFLSNNIFFSFNLEHLSFSIHYYSTGFT